MTAVAARTLFVDTSAFVAWFVTDDVNHEDAVTVFDGIRRGEYPYRPLFTSRYVLSELATLLRRQASHDDAVRVLRAIRESDSFVVLSMDETSFDQACVEFARYDDQRISFVDHTSGVLADENGIEHVFSFDVDDFHTLGFTVVPEDTGEGGAR